MYTDRVRQAARDRVDNHFNDMFFAANTQEELDVINEQMEAAYKAVEEDPFLIISDKF